MSKTYTEREVIYIKHSIKENISKHRYWYIFQGIIFAIAGILALILPIATAVGFGFLIGTLLLISGCVQAIASFRSKSHWWSLISSLLSLIIGTLIIFNPILGAATLAIILAIFLTAEGIIEILLSFQFRAVKNWGCLLFSGLVSLFLAYIVFIGWPVASVVLLGVTVGINLLLYGVSLLLITRSVE